MDEKLKIKISIADRVYPLNIKASQEESLRKAAKNIEAVIKKYEQSYAVKDKQDVLAMCALQFAADNEQKKLRETDGDQEVNLRLEVLHNLVKNNLN
ncbi:cell division protein ZapA [Psychroflexus planctonicus]|uniref:Cell division protein ZapA n=1 Tax=Psychroflexus planctonicus TaxID=1526575 RepID=A0ABQ1SHF3_9FLAO|nr:cell division protein ZapA [Psychroflexus planctonicus]GGE35963.1 cell division protein ZapA [Psychroflexus planctonicus]